MLVYYLKIRGDKLKRLDLNGDSIVVSNKDPKGFTTAETKYMRYLLSDKYKFTLEDIKSIESNIEEKI